MGLALDSTSLVTIFGGSGFVGRHVVRALAKTGARMRVAVRRPDLAGHLQPLGGVGQIHAVQANLRYADSIEKAVAGADAVINLVGLLAEGGKQRFDTIHVEGAKAIAEAATEAHVRAMVHISAIGADEASPSRYARTKAAGEQAVLQAFPEAVILRASVIFGPEDDFINRFGAMAQIAPVLPLVGGGRTRFQPVFVGDVAAAVVASLSGKAGAGRIYELGGPEVLSFKQILETVLRHTKRKRALVSLPFWLAGLQARFLQLLPSPPLTVDQVRLLKSDSIVSQSAIAEARTIEALDIKPVAMEAVIPAYLERFRPKGEFSTEFS